MKKSSSSKKPTAKPKSSLPKRTRKTETKPTDSTAFVSLQQIKDLVEFVAEKQFDEFELERGDFRLRLRKGGSKTTTEIITMPAVSQVTAPPVATPAHPPQTVATPPPVAAPPPAEAPLAEEDLHTLTSPIVGTFYRAASPTAEPFVKLGDIVEANQTLCIVEAMKLMNEIQSDVSGTVVKILVENGQPVEYGQPLFGIKV
jgi:acetyl-CoA carboxylase biotin carboxyl carrier protein